jgi:predicted molibdopterin-dependent oxidoreductase YjgC
MDLDEILEPYNRLIEIRVFGREYRVPENNTILRCLQFLDPENVSDAELCWNGECLDCYVEIGANGAAKRAIACRTNAVEGMELRKVSPMINLSLGDPSDSAET